MCKAIYNSNGGGYQTKVCRQYFLYSIFYISTFYNMPPQAEGGGSTQSLKRKAVKEEVGSGLVKTSAS
jgi:hypothetical protein